MTYRIATISVLALIAGCSKQTDADGFMIDSVFEKTLEQKLLDAKPGDVIDVPAGKYALSRSLSLAVNGVTIRGAGMDVNAGRIPGQRGGVKAGHC